MSPLKVYLSYFSPPDPCGSASWETGSWSPGQILGSDKTFSSAACGTWPEDWLANKKCGNNAGFPAHFDLSVGENTAWSDSEKAEILALRENVVGDNPVVEAEPVECPGEVLGLMRSECSKEMAGQWTYCDGWGR